jgi:vacuolar-type H+-ATPase catalytic subunit A/Vma1
VIGLGPNDFWAIMFIGCLSLFVPKLAFIIPIYVLFNTTKRRSLGKAKRIQAPKEMEQIVLFIQSNKLESLTEAIESNPTILHCDYKKQTLLSWCKFYNNTKALMVVLQMIKKYPPEKTYAMAA